MKQRGRVIAAAAASLPAVWLTSAAGPAHASTPNVLRVGTYNSIPGTYSTIQAAVNAAQPGDWILVGPGDYHETNDHTNPAQPAGVYITTAGLHLRGMDRNGVVVDGTKVGASKCSASAADQDQGALDPSNNGQGRNGIEVYGVNKPANTKFLADNVSIENLTVCNFLNGSGFSGSTGNGVWWNGGDGSGQIGHERPARSLSERHDHIHHIRQLRAVRHLHQQ